MPSSRRNFTLTEKLSILDEYDPGVQGKGVHALGHQYGVSSSTIRGWWAKRVELENASRDRQITIRTARRFNDGGRQPAHSEMEELLSEWVTHRNSQGLRVKDSYIRLHAVNIYRELHGGNTAGFEASSSWLARFKRRRSLVSTDRQQPELYQLMHLRFASVYPTSPAPHRQAWDQAKQNIVNMDQVPRYFETEPKSTITTRSAREVLLGKGGSSHKRFTATFTVTPEGEFLTPHLLFSKLKNKPKCRAGVLVDVNKTGMWSDDLLLSHAQTVVCGRKETQLYREPVVVLQFTENVVSSASTRQHNNSPSQVGVCRACAGFLSDHLAVRPAGVQLSVVPNKYQAPNSPETRLSGAVSVLNPVPSTKGWTTARERSYRSPSAEYAQLEDCGVLGCADPPTRRFDEVCLRW